MTSDWKRWLVRGVKLALVVLVLSFVAFQFHRDLSELDLSEITLRPAWLVASAAIFLLALFPSGCYWQHLHQQFGYPISFYGAQRAQYVAQLGKYVPGKALAILIRANLVHPFGVPYGVSVITSCYEVFTGMAAGAMLAAMIAAIDPPEISAELLRRVGLDFNPVWLGLVLMGMCGIPLWPSVFNFVIAKLTARVQAIELYRLPPVRLPTLAIGLFASAVGWWLQALSVWAMLQAVVPSPPELTPHVWAQCCAAIAFANVLGFVVFILPAGIGLRESFLLMLLGNFGPPKYIAVAVLLLRLDWIVAEVLIALGLYWLKPRGERSESLGSDEPTTP
jgi:uncharacterized membrane protein YbhN (UPF0104 family)